MGLYAKYIFPHLLEWALGNQAASEQREKVLKSAQGQVLEIGFGTGLNLPFYPAAVKQLVAIDPESFLRQRVNRRIAGAKMPVKLIQLDASGRLPFADEEFDCVVTTWTLCSITPLEPALREIRRVLKPSGEYIFLEHGRSDDPQTAKWQDRFNPLQKIIGVGCHVNRKIDADIRKAGFEIVKLDRFLLRDTPRIGAEMYSGICRRPA